MSCSAGIRSLNAYLANLRTKQSLLVHVVLGNEAADLDSMASALMLAYFKSRVRQQKGRAYLPLINIPRAELALRRQALCLFDELGLNPEGLFFRDELDLEALLAQGRLELTLVDHNRLTPSQEHLAPAVLGIVDHHRDEEQHRNAAERIVAPVGCAATLVAEMILACRPAILDAGTGALLLAPILLDTSGLDPRAGRAAARDEEAARRLIALTGADGLGLYRRLAGERFADRPQDSRGLLAGDHKQFRSGRLRWGISSVPVSLEAWAGKDPELAGAFKGFAASRSLDLLLAMLAYQDTGFHRQLALYAAEERLKRRLLSFLRGCGLGLEPLAVPGLKGDEALALFSQGATDWSRKRLQPLLQEFFNGLE